MFVGVRQLDYGFGPRQEQFSIFNELDEGISFFGKCSWIFTMFFIALGLVWSFVGMFVSFLNLFLNDPKTVAGAGGLHLWSWLSVMSYVTAAFLYIRQFYNTIQYNVLLKEHRMDDFSSEGLVHFGVSFYVFSMAVVLHVFPSVMILLTEKHQKISEKEKSMDPTALLY
ncbi:unnamed protein product [Bursaphelenchus okinawaensis]|uniref:Uncharacterized protein n=1 Tax=Bursaphelenchus okinawaensis TaxID=465554 RepID=A0A811KZ77_9BILA|nr:unnamed protein product [Bursaphelenchus okinawaensis]CAG9114694.1 unnamed protein product [Bursaphelenchus okinawaensis]